MTRHVLILDDNRRRHPTLQKVAAELCPGATTTVVLTTADEAKEELGKHSHWDLLLLDHDLGGRIFVAPSDPNTGSEVARFIREKTIKFSRCILHSLNPYGVGVMRKELKGLGPVEFAPFGYGKMR